MKKKTIAQLTEDLRTVTAERDALALESTGYINWIADSAWTGEGDWACSQCHPASDILIPGFVCARHKAIAAREAARLNANPIVLTDVWGKRGSEIVVTCSGDGGCAFPYEDTKERNAQLAKALDYAARLFAKGGYSTVRDDTSTPR